MCAAQQYCLRWNNHRSNLLNVFDELLQNEAFTDVTLACDGGVPIKCHRMVLAACSPYFQNLFTDIPCKHPVVVLKDVKFAEIKAILEYMYRGEVNVAQDQLAALLKVAEALKVKGLVEENRNNTNNHHGYCNPNNTSDGHNDEPMDQSPINNHHHSNHNNTSPGNQNVHSSSSNNSPPHSTSCMYRNPYVYHGNSANSKESGEKQSRRGGGMPIWAMPGVPIAAPPPIPTPPTPTIHTTINNNNTSNSSTGSTSSSGSSTAIMGGFENNNNNNNSENISSSPYHRRKKLSSLVMNRDTPILRTVLGQGNADSSSVPQPVSLVCHPDSRDHSNGPSEERLEKHMKKEPLEDAQSPYTDFTSVIQHDGGGTTTGTTGIASVNSDDVKPKLAPHSPQTYSSAIDSPHHHHHHHQIHQHSHQVGGGGGGTSSTSTSIANYVPQQKPEWKRYKQYTRNDIMSAIEAVRNGMSALQAARKYSVPSRTLYDKVKKLGITTSRPFKRTGGSGGGSSNGGSPACFPYGISGTGGSPIYGSGGGLAGLGGAGAGGGGNESDDQSSTTTSNSMMVNNAVVGGTAALMEAAFLQHAFEARSGGAAGDSDRETKSLLAAVVSGRPSSPSPSPSPTLLNKYTIRPTLTPSPSGGVSGGGVHDDSHHSNIPPHLQQQFHRHPPRRHNQQRNSSETNGSSERGEDEDEVCGDEDEEMGREEADDVDEVTSIIDDNNQVEDLSVGRKDSVCSATAAPSRVIMPPMTLSNQVSTIMKKEELLRDLIKEEARREEVNSANSTTTSATTTTAATAAE